MSASGTVQLDVSILGRDYRIACEESEREALLRAVSHLDARMREIRDAGMVTGIDRIAVMAALNLANDLLRERTELAQRPAGPIDEADLRRRISDMQGAIDRALAGQDKLF
jgi:cell division protein ZapA